MKKQLPIIILSAVCAILAFSLYNQKKENARLTENPETPVGDPVAEVSEPAAEKIVKAEVADSMELAKEVNPATVQKTLEDHQRVMTSIANMRDNPTMNKMIEASQRGTIGALYADMIEYLNLDPEETKYFMDLLMVRQMENVDFGMKLMSGQMSEEEKQELADHLSEVSEQIKEQMKTFLNSDEDYAEFEYYEKTVGERMALSQTDQKLAGTDQPLSDESYRELLDMMYQERTDFDWSTNLNDQDSTDVSAERFSEENMQKHTQDMYTLNEQIFKQAMGMLSPEQFEAFKASITATTDMQLAQFQMAGSLLRGQEN